MKNQLLLLEDIEGLGRSGDIVTAKPGYIRNFLVPQKKAIIADKSSLKLQARLKEERLKKAAIDREASEEFAKSMEGLVLSTQVKVDTEGRMYGSVTSIDIARMLQEKGYAIDRKSVLLPQPIKKLGSFSIELRLKEGVPAKVSLEVAPEPGLIFPKLKAVIKEEETPMVEEENKDAD